MFHFEISGREINDEQPPNILINERTFLVFHLEISGNEVNDEQPLKIL